MANKTGASLAPKEGFGGIISRDPFLRDFEQRMRRIFGEGFGRFFEPSAEESWSLTAWAPSCDIYETDNEIVVKAELPEVKKENIKVSLENNVLMIYGERKFEEETRKENYHRVERSYGEFMRSFTLPSFVDPNKINAEYKDGVLRVTIAKREEAKPKQVEVKVQ
ncbi:MAG: Hsp20/alpha crystallin family protein [Acidobacteria bacterium]|nr:Hsp20/alpha crystallin family protein [Acidobacteriota bacterium]